MAAINTDTARSTAPSITMSSSDLEAVREPSTIGDNFFWPTGALVGLSRISAECPRRESFNTFFIISGISKIESPDEHRKGALAAALDRLTMLQEPLAVLKVQGDVHNREYALTEKGRKVATAIDAATPRGHASWMLGYGDASLKSLQAVAIVSL